MGTITEYMRHEHRNCDELLALTEISIGKQEWDEAAVCFRVFSEATLRHFAAEEDVLFPAFEEATGNASGPTSVMRAEHIKIRDMLIQLNASMTTRNAKQFLGDAETLYIMLQQHNMKEEGILYQMAEQVLRDTKEDIMAAIRHTNAMTGA
ncbi:MAG: hemerythrin domain-containing protein [Proteobacteria bacterium]|nr:hemerythrin domain-containing protein [Pseudomonadota bacterium]